MTAAVRPFAPARAVTLLYHDVTEAGAFATSGFEDPLAQSYKLTIEDFSAHLAAVAAVRPDAPVTVETAVTAERAPWLIAFDDGGASALTPIAELLEGRGWRGHFFVTTGRIGTPGFLDADGVRALAARGHVVGAHTVTHPTRMADLDEATLRREWRDSRAALEALLGARVAVGSVPGGLYAPHVGRAAAAEGIEILFTSEPTTRIAVLDGCLVLGRYCFKTRSPASAAARLAANHVTTRAAEWALWNTKKLVKRVSPKAFGMVRRALTDSPR